MFLVGKRRGRRPPQLIAAVGTSQLLVATDSASGDKYLVDSGAQVSVYPFRSNKQPLSFLLAADGRRIPAWGSVTLPVAIDGQNFGKFRFVRAAVDQPILGADFFAMSGLLIDIRHRRLLRPPAVQPPSTPSLPSPELAVVHATSISAGPPAVSTATPSASDIKSSELSQPPPELAVVHAASVSAGPPAVSTAMPSGSKSYASVVRGSHSPTVTSITLPAEFAALLSEFPQVTNKDSVKFAANPAHGVTHHIETNGRPVFAKSRRLDPAKLAAAKAEFAAMEKAGIIRRADGPWASPLHLVPKPDGSWRPTGDYRLLNAATVPDRYPLPNIRDFTANLWGRCYFSKIDLVKGYYQVPMRPEDVCKTAVITPFGLFEWLVMPFGVRNAANTFQRLMDRLLDGLPFAFVYLDDILVASFTREQHLADVRAVLQRLDEFGMVINPQKSLFCQSSVEFLGHHVTAAGISPIQRHADDISAFKVPANKNDLQRFLGLLNFYRQFLPGIAATLKPLTDALRGGSRSPLIWTPECAAAFAAAKTSLSVDSLLHHPDPAAEISVAVDASGSHVGAVFQQRCGSSAWQPLSFFSRKLSPAQEKYSAFDRELLAAFAAVRHWRHLLEGRPFTLLTDHKPLPAALCRSSQPWSARQQRQLAYLSEFNVVFSHISGAANSAADALSRPPAGSELPLLSTLSALPPCPSVDFAAMAALQSSCREVKCLISSGSLQLRHFAVGSSRLLCDVSAAVPRPLVPASMRREVFEAVHSLAHPGRRATTRLLSSKFVWRGLARDARLWCRQCDSCQRGKVTRHARTTITPVPVPALPFSSVNIDVVGPLPVSGGFRYLLTMIDRTTRWPEVAPVIDTKADTLAAAFVDVWIARFGVPHLLTSDRGAQFTGSLWSRLCDVLGIRQQLTTAYRPQANGLVERFHRRLKDALRARLVEVDWVRHLPWVMLGIRTAPRDDSSTSAAQHALGTALHVPGQFLHNDGFGTVVHLHLSGAPPLQPRHNRVDSPALLRELAGVPMVYIRSDTLARPPLAPLYSGPFAVEGRHESHFDVRVGPALERVNINRLKPAFLPADSVPAAPPRPRGRPRKL